MAQGAIGPDKVQCKATASTSGNRCRRAAIPGGTVCAFHGGNAPQVRAKANERVAEAQLRKELGKLQIVPVENPLLELQILAGEAKAWKELCADHVARLERLRYGGQAGEQIRGEILLFERAMDRCGTILAVIARCNIDERLARIQERQVELVADAVSRVLAEMGLSQEQQREARHGLSRHLRLVAS